MPESKNEKRSRARLALSVPVKVRSQENEQAAVTRDLSMNGIFLYTDQRVSEGSKIEIVLMLPAELGFGDKQWACCEASVVRVEDEGGSKFGVAATIDRLDVLPEIPS